MVSTRLPTGFLVSRGTLDPACAISLSSTRLSLSPVLLPRQVRLALSLHLRSATPVGLLLPVWPAPLSLATTQGISVDVFSSPYLDVSVQAVPLISLFCSEYDVQRSLCTDFSIRKSAGQSSLTAHRSLSQLTTSFFGSQCQGIHPALSFALPLVLALPAFPFRLLFSLRSLCAFLTSLLVVTRLSFFRSLFFAIF